MCALAPVLIVGLAFSASTDSGRAGDTHVVNIGAIHDDKVVALTRTGDLFVVAATGSAKRVRSGVRDFSVNPWNRKRILATLNSQTDDQNLSLAIIDVNGEGLKRSVHLPGTCWRLPFWFSARRCGVVCTLHADKALIAPDMLVIVDMTTEAPSMEGWPYGLLYISMNHERPVFWDDGRCWALFGMLASNESAKSFLSQLGGIAERREVRHGVLTGQGGDLLGGTEAEFGLPAYRVFGPFEDGAYGAAYYAEGRARREKQRLPGLFELVVVDSKSGRAMVWPKWKRHSGSIGAVVAVDFAGGRERVLATSRDEGALMLIDGDNMITVSRRFKKTHNLGMRQAVLSARFAAWVDGQGITFRNIETAETSHVELAR